MNEPRGPIGGVTAVSSAGGSPTILAPFVIVSGPSGSGKSSIIWRVIGRCPMPLRLSVSATTRQPRAGESAGVDYYFWTRERFEKQIAAGAFLEWALVHGNYYGTLRRQVEPFRRQGVGVILDIDVQGAAQVRQQCPDHLSVFIRAPTLAHYEQRLRERGTEDEASLQRRLAAVEGELARAVEYQYVVINADLDAAVADVLAIVERHFPRGAYAG